MVCCFYADVNLILGQDLHIGPFLHAQTRELLEAWDVEVVGPLLKSTLAVMLVACDGR